MRRTLGLVFALSMTLGGVAFAGHGHGGGGGGHGTGRASGGVVVRDHRSGGPTVVRGGGPVVRDHRGPGRSYVRVNQGRYMFPGGVVRVYKRPVIRERYYDVHVRPAMVVESYDPVQGYVWVGGNWTWGGAEWVWSPGYWSVAAEPEPAPVVTGGFSVNAGVSIH